MFDRAVALVFHLGAKSADVRYRDGEFLVGRVGTGPGAVIDTRINRDIWGFRRDRGSHRLVIGRYDAPNVRHAARSGSMRLRAPHKLEKSSQTRQARPQRPA